MIQVSEEKLRDLLQDAYELGIIKGWQASTIKDNFQRGTGSVGQETILRDNQESIDLEINYEINQLKKY